MKVAIRSFLTLLLLLAVSAANAGITGKISGKVTDSDTGEPLVAVNVVVEGSFRGATTDLDGNYIILNISPGKYNVRITLFMSALKIQKILKSYR